MKCNVTTLHELLRMLATKTHQSMDRYGYGIISEKIGGDISLKYLYETLHLRIEESRRNKKISINLQPQKLDQLAQFLGYVDISELINVIENPLNKVLINVIGSYYCYVRRNSKATSIFCSPVRIYENDSKVWFELKGPSWTYKGEVEIRHGCLFVLMQAPEGKQFHHVYKIGQREKPEVLQGIFSGVSTTFDPIGGRVVLIRSDLDFTKMKNSQLDPVKLRLSKSEELKSIEGYFKKFEDNNLSIKTVTTFKTTDLQN